jgi:hypothetical protein
MIKVFKSKCIKNLSYEKTEFINEELYFAYVVGPNSINVINGENRKGFCNIEKCMFLHGHPYGFQKYFEILDTFYVKNKKQLRMLNQNSIKE